MKLHQEGNVILFPLCFKLGGQNKPKKIAELKTGIL